MHIERQTLRIEYCHRKGIHWCVEQPSSSLLRFYKPFEAGPKPFQVKRNVDYFLSGLRMQEIIKRHKAKVSFFSMGMMGGHTQRHGFNLMLCYMNIYAQKKHVSIYPHDLRKQSMLISTAPWLDDLNCQSLTAERRIGRGVGFPVFRFENIQRG